MSNYLFGLFLILYGVLKMIITLLNEVSPNNLRIHLKEIPILGHIFEDEDDSFGRHAFNICFFIYGIHTLLHGLNLNNYISVPEWILSHDANYALHTILGLFMIVLYYSLLDVNHAFYVVEGFYSGLAILAMVPIIYLMRDIKRSAILKVVSYFSLFAMVYVAVFIAQKYPKRVPNVVDMIAIPLSSL